MTVKEAILTLNANVIIACERAGFDSATVKMIEDALDVIEIALQAQEPETSDTPKSDNNVGCWYDITHNYTLEQVVSALKAQEPVEPVLDIDQLLRSSYQLLRPFITQEGGAEGPVKASDSEAAEGWNKRAEEANDAERIPHGCWLPSEIPHEKYVCSHCGGACWYYDYEGIVARSRFCPNCGAKMDEKEQ